jgi:DNA-binding NtrC family response regulator
MADKPAMILIVDDEMDVLRLAETVLRQAGHPVTAARSADAAIRAVETMAIKPTLLLTDVVMPGMSGPLLADQLMTNIPGLRVLFMSGYDERQIVQRYVVEKGFSLLTKPFKPQALLNAVRESLARRPAEDQQGVAAN